jgi:2-polyprenyl-6-methoxyphenol hydroxylase-like FAD-dependent oxidoreductase
MRTDHDVVVVGARCAGAATALLLARGGLSVLLVDRARAGSDTLSTHALTRPGVLALHRWGVLDAVRAAGTPPVRRVVQHYSDSPRAHPHRAHVDRASVVDVPIRAAAGVDALYAPRRWLLDRLLTEAAAEAGAEVVHGVAARDLIAEGDRVAGVRIAGRGGGVPVRARFVVGADGVRSGVARRVGAPAVHRGRHATDTVYTYVDGLPDDAYRNWFVPGAAAGLIPTNGGRACVWVGGPAGLRWSGDRADRLTDVLAAVAPDVARRAARTARGPHPAYAGPPGFTRRVHGPGWALVGDAAHYTDPIGAHGMTAALVGAELLARALLDAAGGVPEEVALAGYARTHRRLTEPMAAAVDRAASYRWDAAGLRRAHIAMNAAMRAEWSHLVALTPPPIARRAA